jgi:endonuclease YncB( thermonuclease family)
VIKTSKPVRKATVELRPSRIRREPVRIEPERKKVTRRSREQDIWLGIAGVGLFATAIAVVTLGFSVISAPDPGASAAAAAAAARFGPCEGGPNCVVDGETIRIAGQTVRIAGIDTPPLQSAACPQQELVAAQAIEKLTGLLNSGTVTLGPPVRASDGELRRPVLVDGKDVAPAMIVAGVAEAPGSLQGSGCG